ncbi:ABC transporter substrate-binding protein [Streptomyces mobaraensis NBRC 13819 = DSM 40847]|uniref:Family 1 extracellular solute-binding protein n=1 Tax=Streptomyces mobaraensis (strain ATCC 29032 / DSM 40847 / JCM 4168 / NBRC 13819 / NCIMB 11159 / IPCR 16-22) TaxID=1223523 RepID=M3BPC8_STRM1|nr:ABC transporter substrate-binding protein [Streptomyces mobaraensis]EMF01510.1 family 1 extracellular solute-binding protein [Streptomyces mobaraensis NBRC 13819 = DSM 40847]QTT72134.1 ABC transporter substrate-binding protein [Streptomyces mobaraensis NBRC 13819 = DSM 40847]
MKSTRKVWAAAATLGVLAASGVTVAAAAPSASSSAASASSRTSKSATASEDAQLRKLYKEALAEGGRLVVYAGGDKPGQADYLKNAFLKQFPKMKVDTVVDFSKNHDARLDQQIAEHKVVADVVHLQTLDDFPRWKKEGALEKYKPVGWNKVYDKIKDKDGYYTGLFFIGFANVTATTLGDKAPVEAEDFLKPEFKNKLVFTYPNDDDAVLYYFKQLTDKYGTGYLKKLMAQNPKFVRGTADASAAVGKDGYVANFGSSGSSGGLSKTSIPEKSPWVAWPQTGAILKDAPHKAAAKLYLSWVLSKGYQEKSYGWSARTDVPAPAGRKGIFDYANMNPLGLGEFMGDRTALDRFKAKINLFVGDVKGADPADPEGKLGLYPVDQAGTQG